MIFPTIEINITILEFYTFFLFTTQHRVKQEKERESPECTQDRSRTLRLSWREGGKGTDKVIATQNMLKNTTFSGTHRSRLFLEVCLEANCA